MDALLRDLRYATRTLRRNPGFTVVALLTLSLGIGANSGMFSVVAAVLLKPLPYPDSDRIVSVAETGLNAPRRPVTVAPRNFLDWKEQSGAFEALAAFRQQSLILTGRGEPERLASLRVSADYFRVFGVEAAVGRTFLPADDEVGAARAAVLSHALWQQRFGGDPLVIGSDVLLDGQSFTIVGVAPAGFRAPGIDAAVYATPAWPEAAREARGAHLLEAVGRLKPGASVEQADREMAAIAARIAADYPNPQEGWGAMARPLQEAVVGGAWTPLYVLMGAVFFVLLIACGNVANLCLARATARRKEMAVRCAVGAGRWPLVRQTLAEALLLSLGGAVLGLVAASWAIDLLAAAAPAALPRAHEVTVGGRVIGFTLGMSLLAMVVTSLAPALQVSRTGLAEVMRDGRRVGGTVRQRTRDALVVAQIALSLLLLIGAGLMLKSFHRLSTVDPGFATDHVLSLQVPLPAAKYDTAERQRDFVDQLLARVGVLPGVHSAGVTSIVPLSGRGAVRGVWMEGQESATGSEVTTVNVYAVSSGYLETVRIPLRRGRAFQAQDRPDGPRSVLINETMARTVFAGADPLGRRLRIGNPTEPLAEVVGIVGDTKHGSLGDAAPAQAYELYSQVPAPGLSLVLRTAGDPALLTRAVRAEVRAIDPDQPLGRVATLDQIVAESVAAPRFSMMLLVAFAGIAVALALVGIYGVIAHTVSQRTHEFGIRMALGARTGTVLLQVVGQAMKVAGLGIALGLGGALLLSRVLTGLLYQVSSTDPLTYVVLAALIAAVAALASLLPALRAARVDPIVAMRAE